MTNVNGHPVREAMWRSDETKIRERASFDLQCPSEKLELRLLETTPDQRPMGWPDPWAIGVSGCNKQGTYKNSNSGWFLNATTPGPS
jgi:hypothetical protein